MSTNTKLTDKARQALACMRGLQTHLGCDVCEVEADELAAALAAHDAEQAQQSERDAILARLEAVPVPEPFSWPTTGHGGRFVSAERLNDYRAAMLAAAKGGTQ